jgi:hypothetical protein
VVETQTKDEVIFEGELIGNLGIVCSPGDPEWEGPDCKGGDEELSRGPDGVMSTMFSCTCGSKFIQHPGRVVRQ